MTDGGSAQSRFSSYRPPPPGLALPPNSCVTPGKRFRLFATRLRNVGRTLPESATFKQRVGTLPAALGMGREALGAWGGILHWARGSRGGSRPTRTTEADVVAA